MIVRERRSRELPATSVGRVLRAALPALLALATCACGPSPQSRSTEPTGTESSAAADADWREFGGIWTSAGRRETIPMGAGRSASIARLGGALLLSGSSAPTVGFRADAIVLNDSATGTVGRSVWTDDNGDQVFSELRGDGTATGKRIVGKFVGGTGRYSGVTGDFEFSWRFVLEAEDGVVQGQSEGLKGRFRGVAAKSAAGGAGS